MHFTFLYFVLVGVVNSNNLTCSNMRPRPRPLPVEVIETEILSRLPVKSLLRYRSVCKLWKTIISKPDFVKSHLDCTSKNPNDENLLMLKRLPSEYKYDEYDYEISTLSSFNSKETILSDIVPYFTAEGTSLIGSVNGLVCLGLPNLRKFVIWNPAIRRVKIIKAPIKVSMQSKFLGFGWDEVENDYKVVIMSFTGRNNVYSCKSNRWTSLSNFPLDRPNDHCLLPSVIVKGEPYWTTTHSKITSEKRITSVQPFKFEVGRNEFKILPEFECKSPKDGFLLVNVKECISALVSETNSSECSVDVHCLDDTCGSWRKIYNVGTMTLTYVVKELLHYFTFGGQIVFNVDMRVPCYGSRNFRSIVYTTIKKVVWYDPRINKVEGLCNNTEELIKCFSYKASLVWLKGMKLLHQARSVKKTKRARVEFSEKPRRSARTIKRNPKYFS